MTSEMPDLRNFTRAEAQKVLEGMGVNISVDTIDTKDVVDGSVVKTDPEMGTIVTSGSTVTIYIAIDQEKNIREVPNVVGSVDLATARRAITAAGLRVASFTTAESFDPVGTVIAQTPDAGTELPAGGSVILVVSSGPPKCPDCGSIEHTVHPECEFCGTKEHLTEEHPCEYCEEEGHDLEECEKAPTCSYCGEKGHKVSKCEKAPKCSYCDKKGHKVAECPDAPTCSYCGEKGHKLSACEKAPTCSECGKKGHKKSDCPDKKTESSSKDTSSSDKKPSSKK